MAVFFAFGTLVAFDLAADFRRASKRKVFKNPFSITKMIIILFMTGKKINL